MRERSGSRNLRCAIYTRKSSEEGLEQDFNSLHAQREACEGVVTLSQTERNLPTTANVDESNFKDLACWLIVQMALSQ
jgi:hypothetical protein